MKMNCQLVCCNLSAWLHRTHRLIANSCSLKAALRAAVSARLLRRKSCFRWFGITLCGGVLLELATARVAAVQFHVAPGGRDSSPGTQEKPFASFRQAQQAVRAERRAHPEKGVEVVFAAGTY